jgi:hypothetical protein
MEMPKPSEDDKAGGWLHRPAAEPVNLNEAPTSSIY